MLNWKKGWRWLRFLLTLILVSLLIVYSYNNREELTVLTTISWHLLFILVVLMFISMFIRSLQSVILYWAIGIPIRIWEGFGLAVFASMTSLLFPHASFVTKAVYLKKKYQLPYSQIPAIFLGNFVVFLLVGALVMMVSNFTSLILGYNVPAIFWAGIVAAVASTFLFWFEIPIGITNHLGHVGNMLRLFSVGWQKLRNNRALLVKAGLLQLLSFVINGFIISLAYQSLNLGISPLIGTSMAVFVSFSNLVMITPGNIGVQEIVYGYLSELSGVVFVQGIVISTLIRVIGWLTILFAAPICWYLLFFRQNLSMPQIGDGVKSIKQCQKYP
jgi:uncharacterized membrane protein YbhN (UPF0104 family)